MKRYLLSGLLVAATAMVAVADTISLNSGRAMVGRVAVGPNIGSACSLMVSNTVQDLFAPRYEVNISLMKYANKKWSTTKSEAFSMQTYNSDTLFGSKQIMTKSGVAKKITASMFLDQQTQTYKLILHEAKLVSDGSTGKFIVCEKMVLH